jgi:hypothetical protein
VRPTGGGMKRKKHGAVTAQSWMRYTIQRKVLLPLFKNGLITWKKMVSLTSYKMFSSSSAPKLFTTVQTPILSIVIAMLRLDGTCDGMSLVE